jgi:uncharacterized protein YecE (DUF72 family)
VARYVDTIEINTSFYRPVSPHVAESWLSRTADLPDFRFTAKAHRSMTHEPGTGSEEAAMLTLPGLRPLLDAGRLGALLLQFPQSFHCTRAALERLDRALPHLEHWPVAIEVRHGSWASAKAVEWFRSRDLGWCAVDQPRIGDITLGVLPRVTSSLGYVRLHGRNAADWFRPGAGRDARYDYLYSAGQLRELESPLRAMADATENLFVVQNNHFRGKALVNALQMKGLLLDGKPAAPQELVVAYPDLESAVHVERSRLF